MNKKIRSTIQYIFFLVVGIFLFYLAYKDFDLKEFKGELYQINFWWIGFSFVFGILSHLSRAVRWRLLIQPLGHKPGLINTVLSVFILYFVNLAIPRGGELARCTALSKYEKIPITKLFGTVVTERLLDVIVLFLMIFVVVLLQLSQFDSFVQSHPEIVERFRNISSVNNVLLITIAIGITIVAIIAGKKIINSTKIGEKIKSYLISFKEGILSIKKVEKKGWLIFHSLFIYCMYYGMFHVVFYSYAPTSNISLLAGLSAFIAGGLAMLAPVQGGIGAWHFMVFETLAFFGVAINHGKIFAFVSYTFTNLLVVIAGVISFIILPLLNRNVVKPVE